MADWEFPLPPIGGGGGEKIMWYWTQKTSAIVRFEEEDEADKRLEECAISCISSTCINCVLPALILPFAFFRHVGSEYFDRNKYLHL